MAASTTARAFRVRITADTEPRTPVFENFSAYAQDTARVSPRLTVTYGLRWELNPPPRGRRGREPFAVEGLVEGDRVTVGAVSSVVLNLKLAPRGAPLWRTTYNNFAPRVGLAARPFGERGTVLRGGFGIFYDLGTGQAGQAFGSVFPFAREKVLTNVSFPLDPVLGAPPPVTLDPPYGTVYGFLRGLKLPYAAQWNATLDQPVGRGQLLSVSYVGARGRRLLRQSLLLRPDPKFTHVRVTSNGSRSDYSALQVQFVRRLSEKLQAHVSYTFSRSEDDDSDDSSNLLFLGDFDRDRERGPSTFDVRHSLVAAASYRLPAPRARGVSRALLGGWSVDSIVRARTATPVNVVLRTGELFGDLVEARRPDLVPGAPLYVRDPSAPGGRRINRAAFAPPADRQGSLGRNALRGYGFSQVDAALRRRFVLGERPRLELRAEVFNLFNRANFGDPVGDLSSAHFGESTQTLARSLGAGGANGGLSPLYQVGGPRSVQLALRLQF